MIWVSLRMRSGSFGVSYNQYVRTEIQKNNYISWRDTSNLIVWLWIGLPKKFPVSRTGKRNCVTWPRVKYAGVIHIARQTSRTANQPLALHVLVICTEFKPGERTFVAAWDHVWVCKLKRAEIIRWFICKVLWLLFEKKYWNRKSMSEDHPL